jgi:hypothetical protein
MSTGRARCWPRRRVSPLTVEEARAFLTAIAGEVDAAAFGAPASSSSDGSAGEAAG